jgi:hypothetical protein
VTRRRNDPHAERREEKHRKRRYGMQVSGRSVKLLAALVAKAPPQDHRAKGKKKKRS